MKIETIPPDLDYLLYDKQKEELVERLGEPIVAIMRDRSSPVWNLLDGLLNGGNLIKDLSRDNEVSLTVHELGKGVILAWTQDDHSYEYDDTPEDYLEAILVNDLVLRSIKEWLFI